MQSLYPNKDFRGIGKRFFGGRINNGLQTITSLRKGADVTVQRYFTQLSAAGGQHYTIPTVTPDTIEMTVMSPTGSTVGLPIGATALTANKLQTISFPYVGDPIIYIGRNALSYLSGYIADVKFFVGGNLVRHYPLDDDGSTNLARELVSGANGTRVNLTQASTELYELTDGVWSNIPTTIPDLPITSELSTKLVHAFGLDVLMEGYTGFVAQISNGFDVLDVGTVNNVFDINFAAQWLNGADGYLVKLYDQAGSEVTHDYVNQPLIISGGSLTHTMGVDWSNTDGQLYDNGLGASAIYYNGVDTIGESTTTNINSFKDDTEFHFVYAPSERKIQSNVSDHSELEPSARREYLWSYGIAGNNVINEQLCFGTTLEYGNRNGLGGGGTNQAISNSAESGGVRNLTQRLKKNGVKVNCIAAIDGNYRRYQRGMLVHNNTPSAGNYLADTNFNNGKLVTGQDWSTQSGRFGHFKMAGIFITKKLTDQERHLLQKRTYLWANNHLSDSNVLDYFDELIDFRDFNSNSVVGKKGKLTLNFNPGGDWIPNYTNPQSGMTGLRAVSGTNAANTFEATDNYFADVTDFAVLAYGQIGYNDIQDYFALARKDESTNHANWPETAFSIGADHNTPRFVLSVDTSIDPIGYADSYGYNDQSGGGKSQPMIKYGYKLTNGGWNELQVTTADNTLREIYGSVFIPEGTTIDDAFVLQNGNIVPPTPELRLGYYNAGYTGKTVGFEEVLIATHKANPTYDRTIENAPLIKSAYNKLYATIGSGLFTVDNSVAIHPDNGNHAVAMPDYRIMSSKRSPSTRSLMGTYYLFGFIERHISDSDAAIIEANLFKLFQEERPVKILEIAT